MLGARQGQNIHLFCAAFHQWLEKMGMWDYANFYNHNYGPVFTITALDETGREIQFQQPARVWYPTHLECAYTAIMHQPLPLYASEQKMVLPEDRKEKLPLRQ